MIEGTTLVLVTAMAVYQDIATEGVLGICVEQDRTMLEKELNYMQWARG